MAQQLIDSVQKVVKGYFDGKALTDVVIGTVTKLVEEPFDIEITLEGTMLPIPKALMYFTEDVIEKYLEIAGHTHEYEDRYEDGEDNTRETEVAIAQITGYENKIALPGGNTERVTINRPLQMGDKVIMLRIFDGQKFVVWTRIYEL